VNCSFGFSFAISAILASFVCILLSTPVCRKCVPTKIDDMSPPSLYRHYSVSSVVCSDPTPYSPFDILPCDRLFVILPSEERAGSPKLL
jgi:hypothetical protein